jgi:hypothetical protein
MTLLFSWGWGILFDRFWARPQVQWKVLGSGGFSRHAELPSIVNSRLHKQHHPHDKYDYKSAIEDKTQNLYGCPFFSCNDAKGRRTNTTEQAE